MTMPNQAEADRLNGSVKSGFTAEFGRQVPALRPDTVAPGWSMHQPTAVKQITRIIPLRINNSNSNLIDRLSYLAHDLTAPIFCDVLVVDDGSPHSYAELIQKLCRSNGYDYVRLDTEHKIISIARCRNFGAMVAKTDYIFMMDCDFMAPEGFFKKLHDEVSILKLSDCSEDFIIIPTPYLTEEGTQLYLRNKGWLQLHEYLHYTIVRDPKYLEKYSSGTSTCLYNRRYFLSRGGNSEDFSGWGYEDLEFNLRLIRLSKAFPIPRDFSKDISSFDKQFAFRGWKSVYRLYGDRSFMKGMVVFHAWHPVDEAGAYRGSRHKNGELFNHKLKEFVAKGIEPEALPDLNRGRSLVLRNNAFTFSRSFRTLLGDVVHVSAEEVPSNDKLREYLSTRSIDRIVFHNPYFSPETQRIYDWVREEGFPFVVCERGALNGSILFDETGFLADSARFSPECWKAPLTSSEKQALLEYTHIATSSGEALEEQGRRVGGMQLRSEVGVGREERLVVICLQRPGDTATRFFPGPLGTYGDYLMALEDISSRLPPNVRLAYKVHPLEDEAPRIQGLDLSKYHINDVLDAADSMVVFTSGTGVLAMLWRLPVIVCGNAFYKNEQITYAADTKDQLMDLICSPLRFNEEASQRFLSYLINTYYSFGTFFTKPVRLADGSRMTATTDIQFSVLRAFGLPEMRFACRSKPEDAWQSMLFDRYVGTKTASDTAAGEVSDAVSQPKSGTGQKLNTKPQRVSMAKRIYRGSRNIPVARNFVNLFVPLHDYIAKSKKQKAAAR